MSASIAGTLPRMASSDEETSVETVRHPHLADIGTERDDGPLRPPPSMRTLEDDEATERAFLRGIAAAPRDVACRLVYADWLEERGRHDCAELVRSELTLLDIEEADPREPVLRHRVKALTPLVSVEMRRAISRGPIEGCDEPAACARSWDALRATADPCARRCVVCDRDVLYASSVAEAIERVAVGTPVVVDATVARTPGDLVVATPMQGGAHVPQVEGGHAFELPPDTERTVPDDD